MTYTFYVVDEKAVARAKTPESIVAAIREFGGRWSVVEVGAEHFAAAFELLDAYAGNEDFLRELAFRGSPDYVLAGNKGQWALGYFEASLVHDLDGAFRLQSEEIEPVLRARPDPLQSVCDGFLSALEEANERGFAVAIIHG